MSSSSTCREIAWGTLRLIWMNEAFADADPDSELSSELSSLSSDPSSELSGPKRFRRRRFLLDDSLERSLLWLLDSDLDDFSLDDPDHEDDSISSDLLEVEEPEELPDDSPLDDCSLFSELPDLDDDSDPANIELAADLIELE